MGGRKTTQKNLRIAQRRMGKAKLLYTLTKDNGSLGKYYTSL